MAQQSCCIVFPIGSQLTRASGRERPRDWLAQEVAWANFAAGIYAHSSAIRYHSLRVGRRLTIAKQRAKKVRWANFGQSVEKSERGESRRGKRQKRGKAEGEKQSERGAPIWLPNCSESLVGLCVPIVRESCGPLAIRRLQLKILLRLWLGRAGGRRVGQGKRLWSSEGDVEI